MSADDFYHIITKRKGGATMRMLFTCKKCRKTFPVLLENGELPERCPNHACQEYILNADNELAKDIQTNICNAMERMYSVTLIGMDTAREEICERHQRAENLFETDVNRLLDVFRESSIEVQEIMASVMDEVYLMLYHDANDSRLERLQATQTFIRDAFFKHVENKNAEMNKLLLSDEE